MVFAIICSCVNQQWLTSSLYTNIKVRPEHVVKAVHSAAGKDCSSNKRIWI